MLFSWLLINTIINSFLLQWFKKLSVFNRHSNGGTQDLKTKELKEKFNDKKNKIFETFPENNKTKTFYGPIIISE